MVCKNLEHEGMTFVPISIISSTNLHRRPISFPLSPSPVPEKWLHPTRTSIAKTVINMDIQRFKLSTNTAGVEPGIEHVTMFPCYHSGFAPHQARASETQPFVSVPIASPNKVARNINIQEKFKL